ncbi:MAG TPA: metal ABC transporter ATP-binding protein [Pseudomonadales bacterium]
MQGPAIHADDLSLRLGASRILNNMTFSIASGALHCFVGPNGGGKTSTARCLLGQMPHTGTIRFDWPGAIRTIGYVPQLIEMERTLPLTIDNFMTALSQDKPAFMATRKETKALIDAALDRAGLTAKRKYMIGSLSGGERQRLLFAQALIPAPALLVLDEPMTSLDEGGARLFEELILQEHANGTTIVWINHDLDQVARLAQSVTVIDRGVLAHGPTATTLTADMQRGVFPKPREAA